MQSHPSPLTQLRKPRSMRAAINAMCKACLYDPLAAGCGTWRQQTEACTAANCPLFDFRPTSRSEREAA